MRVEHVPARADTWAPFRVPAPSVDGTFPRSSPYQASENWRSMLGVLFLTTTVVMMVSGVPVMMGTCVEWPRLAREYLSGSNSMTAALFSYSFLQLPYMVGPALFASIVYWMAGASCGQ